MTGSDPQPARGPDDETPPSGDNLGKRAVRGAAVTVAGQIGKIALQMLSVVTLAHLLTPGDYGLLAMVTAIVGIADIFRDFGLSSAAIQSPTLSRAEQSNLFWINTGLGAALTLLTMASAPLIAALYGQPALTMIAVGLAINFLLNGMATQYRADLNRRMHFRQLAFADVTGPALGLAVAVALALAGGGFWALVAQQVVQVGTMLIMVMIGARWLPGRYRRAVSVRRFLKFGFRLAGSQLLGYMGNNTDTVALGLTVTPTQLGLYNRSYQLVMTPLGQIRGPLNSVAVPVLSRIQSDDRSFQTYIARAQIAMGYSLVVGLAVMAAVAHPLVALLLGSKWLDAAPILSLLAIGAGFQTLSYVGYWVYVTKGLVDHLLQYTLLSTAFRVACVLVGAIFGVLGVATAMAAVPLLLWPVSFWWLSRRASVPMRQLWLGGLRVIMFAALVGAVSATAVNSTTPLGNNLVSATAGLLAGAFTYALLGWLIPAFRKDLAGVFALAKNLRR